MATTAARPTPALSADFGVVLPRDLPAEQVLEFARRSEALGFDELWVIEDLGYRGGFAQTAAVLAVTSTITVGIGILPVHARNVAFTALEAGTLAELFPGRLHLGIGHGVPGWMRQIGAWPKSPVTYFEEYATALRQLLAGEKVSVEGRYITLDGVQLDSPPSQRPPVLAGVRGPKSLAAAGRSADGTILAEPVTPEYARWAREQIAAGPEHRLVAYHVAAVSAEDPEGARDLARLGCQWIGEPDSAAHLAPSAFAEELAALRAQAADRFDFVRSMPQAWLDQLAITGMPDEARAQLATRVASVIDSNVLIPVGPDPLAALETLASLRP